MRAVKDNEDRCFEEDEGLVHGEAVQSWLSSVKTYESASGCLPNQIVYSYDGEGNEVPIGIIIDGTFEQGENNMQMSWGQDNNDILDGNTQWIAGQEECVTDEYCAAVQSNEEIFKVESPKQDIPLDINDVSTQDVIKVYKTRRGKKPTLNNLKKRKEVKTKVQNFHKKMKVKVKKGNILSKVMTRERKCHRRKKRSSDLAYIPPQSA